MNNEIFMRGATHEDIADICSCEKRYPEAVGIWSHEQHEAALSDLNICTLIFYTEEAPFLGYAILKGLTSSSHSIELMRLALTTPGQGTGKTVLRLLQAYAFEQLKANRLWLDVREHNYRAQKAYAAVGFQREGLLREAIYAEGAYHSLYIMAILRGEYLEQK